MAFPHDGRTQRRRDLCPSQHCGYYFDRIHCHVGSVCDGTPHKKNPVGAYNAIKPRSPWKLAGYIGVFGSACILSFYGVVAGWALGYFYKTIGGAFKGNITWQSSDAIFRSFTGRPLEIIFCLFVIIGLTTFVISKGVRAGIERWSKILMPVLFGLIILLAIRAVTLPGAGTGLAFYLKPDFSKFNMTVLFFAVGQAFFSLSLGAGTMITYASYLPKSDNLVSSAGWVCFFDSLIAILAGIIIFPTLFATPGITPDKFEASGGLMFQVFPIIKVNINSKNGICVNYLDYLRVEIAVDVRSGS